MRRSRGIGSICLEEGMTKNLKDVSPCRNLLATGLFYESTEKKI